MTSATPERPLQIRTIDVTTSQSMMHDFFKLLEARMPGENPEIQATVRGIISTVRTQGKSGLLEIREQLEGIPSTNALHVAVADLESIASTADKQLVKSLETSIERVKKYHNIQRDSERILREENSHFSSYVQPLDAVALYVPGGKAFYPSSFIHTAVPAIVAGVPRIAVFTPARSTQNPIFAAVALLLGIKEIYAVGGAQAVAAATFGVEGISKCDKIVGPGNIYVATAKQLLAGRIGIDSFAGPSEILILSDGTSPAAWIAADMLAQAEHDEEASSILITTDASEVERIQNAVNQLLPKLGARSYIARSSLAKYGAIIVAPDQSTQVSLANQLHAEHLHIHTANALTESGRSFWKQELRGVGAVFFGRYASEAFGDYLAGPSHVLPTAGTARFSSPLGVYDFYRRSSHLWIDSQLARQLAHDTESIALAEELPGHALSAALRFSQGSE